MSFGSSAARAHGFVRRSTPYGLGRSRRCWAEHSGARLVRGQRIVAIRSGVKAVPGTETGARTPAAPTALAPLALEFRRGRVAPRICHPMQTFFADDSAAGGR